MRVRYTQRARADFQAIFGYTHLRSPRGADKVRDAIRRAADLIGRDPGRGHPTDHPTVKRVPVVRYRYAIYFRVQDGEVQIVHIRHTSRRPPLADEL